MVSNGQRVGLALQGVFLGMKGSGTPIFFLFTIFLLGSKYTFNRKTFSVYSPKRIIKTMKIDRVYSAIHI